MDTFTRYDICIWNSYKSLGTRHVSVIDQQSVYKNLTNLIYTNVVMIYFIRLFAVTRRSDFVRARVFIDIHYTFYQTEITYAAE